MQAPKAGNPSKADDRILPSVKRLSNRSPKKAKAARTGRTPKGLTIDRQKGKNNETLLALNLIANLNLTLSRIYTFSQVK